MKNALPSIARAVLVRIVARAAAALLMTAASAMAQVTGEIGGRVVDANTAQPISNARIELRGRPDVLHSGAEGRFTIRGLEPRLYVIRATAIGYEAVTVEYDVLNGRTTDVRVEMSARPSVLTEMSVVARGDSAAPNATVFDRTAIENSGRRDVAELIQSVPGVVVVRDGGPGQPSRVSIRGSSASQVLVLVDGVALNYATSGTADLSRLPLETVQRVTVLTGAQSARYGPRAMAGVVDIETRRAGQEMSATVRGGSYGERNAALTVSGERELGNRAGSLSVSADARSVDGDFDFDMPAARGGGRGTRINSRVQGAGFVANGAVTGDNSTVGANASWQAISRGLAGTIIQQSATGRQTNGRFTTGVQGEYARRAWTLSATATYARESATYDDGAPPYGQVYHDTAKTNGVTALATISRAGVVPVSTGVEARTLSVRSTSLSGTRPRNQQLYGVWSAARVESTLPLSFVGAYELNARVDYSTLSGQGALSPRIAVRASRGVLALSTSLGAGFAPPTLSDQFFTEGVQVRANPSLRPERTRNDIEGRIAFSSIVAGPLEVDAQGAVYRADIDGMILWMPDFRFVWSPSNYNVRRNGYELSALARIKPLSVDVRGTLNQSNITYAGGVISGQVAYRPRVTGNTGITFGPQQLRFDFGARYTGWRRVSAGSALNSLRPFWMADAMLKSTVHPRHWTITTILSTENVFSESASMLVDYPYPPRSLALSVRVLRSHRD